MAARQLALGEGHRAVAAAEGREARDVAGPWERDKIRNLILSPWGESGRERMRQGSRKVYSGSIRNLRYLTVHINHITRAHLSSRFPAGRGCAGC